MALTQFFPGPVDSTGMIQFAQRTVVNIEDPSGVSVVNFGVPDSEGTLMVVAVTLPSSELISALTSAAVVALNIPNFTQNDGTYNPAVAQLMSYYASWTRNGEPVEPYYILGQEDVYNLLAQDPNVQEMWVNNTLRNNGFEGISGLNGIPLVQKGVSHLVKPSKEAFKAKLPAGSKVTDSEELPPPEGGEGGLNVIGVYSHDPDDNKWWLLGGVAAAGLAGYTVFRMMKRGRK